MLASIAARRCGAKCYWCNVDLLMNGRSDLLTKQPPSRINTPLLCPLGPFSSVSQSLSPAAFSNHRLHQTPSSSLLKSSPPSNAVSLGREHESCFPDSSNYAFPLTSLGTARNESRSSISLVHYMFLLITDKCQVQIVCNHDMVTSIGSRKQPMSGPIRRLIAPTKTRLLAYLSELPKCDNLPTSVLELEN